MTQKRWKYAVGMLPHRVTAYEDVRRGGVVHLRWKTGPGQFPRKSLGFTLRTGSRLSQEAVARAQGEAERQYKRLIGEAPIEQRAMTLAEGLALITDAERGRYRVKTQHRTEITRCMEAVMQLLGRDRAFTMIERGDIRTLWRRELSRQKAHKRSGHRAAELIVSRLFLVAAWLRDEEKIPVSACLPWKAWKEEFATDCGDIAPNRPRHTIEEYRDLLEAAPKIDERFALLFSFGAELRLGQVSRLRRLQVSLEATEMAPNGAFIVKGAGKKRGTLVVMTKGQRSALDAALLGYLAPLEKAFLAKTVADYPIFPGGKLRQNLSGKLLTKIRHATLDHVDGTTIRKWFKACEKLAEIAHVKGRGWYGVRRRGVDGAKAGKISREGLQAWGGWSDTQIPDTIYADQDAMYAAAEAAGQRAKLRGEE